MFFLLVGLVSCKLEREDYTQIYPENFYKNEADVKSAVTSAYHRFHINSWGGGGLYATGRYGGINIFTEITTDIMDCHWGDGGAWESYHTHNWSVSNILDLGGEYGNYKYISQFRQIMLDIEKSSVSDNIKQKYIGELKVLRGWLMYLLYDLFGPLPVASDEILLANPDAAPILPRLSEEEYVSLMVKEFKDALANEYLPEKATEWGRVDKGIASMMLLKVYMHAGNWTEAEKVAREVTGAKYGYKLMDDYYDCFTKKTEQNSENIWSIICDNENYVNGWITHVLSPTYPYQNSNAEAWSGYRMVWDFYETYDPNDKRLEYIIAEYVSKSGELVNKENPTSELLKGPMPLKYTVDPDQIGDKSGTDIPMLRYSDALLCLAECIVRVKGAPTQEAMELINKVRNRAGLDDLLLADYTDVQKFYDMLLLERGHELYCEGHRRTDLIRFGKYIEFNKRVPNSQTADHKVLFPIPNSYIIEGKGEVKQNPGY